MLVDAQPQPRITSSPVSATNWKKPPPRRVRAIRDRLRLVYGIPQAKPHGHPIAELILTVLSQSTNDRNRDVAYLALREVLRRRGELNLDFLGQLPLAESKRWLTSLDGIGPKTAACVLLFALGMHDVPVDTHVSRVGTRLGLFRPKAPFEQLHDTMLEITPPDEELEFHMNLLRHGRRTCYARRPNCWECALQRMCPSAAEFMGAGRP